MLKLHVSTHVMSDFFAESDQLFWDFVSQLLLEEYILRFFFFCASYNIIIYQCGKLKNVPQRYPGPTP
jgi:hypothetical protein